MRSRSCWEYVLPGFPEFLATSLPTPSPLDYKLQTRKAPSRWSSGPRVCLICLGSGWPLQQHKHEEKSQSHASGTACMSQSSPEARGHRERDITENNLLDLRSCRLFCVLKQRSPEGSSWLDFPMINSSCTQTQPNKCLHLATSFVPVCLSDGSTSGSSHSTAGQRPSSQACRMSLETAVEVPAQTIL